MTEGCAEEHGESGDEAEAGGETVDAIDEVDGVGAGDEPEDGGGEGPPPLGEFGAGETHDADAGEIGDDGGEDLAGKFEPGAETEEVIDEAD